MQKFHGWCSIPYEENSYTSGLLHQPSFEVENWRNNEDLTKLKVLICTLIYIIYFPFLNILSF